MSVRRECAARAFCFVCFNDLPNHIGVYIPRIKEKMKNLFVIAVLMIFLSISGSAQWSLLKVNNYDSGNSFATAGNYLFYGTYNNAIGNAEIYRSTNNGTNWILTSTGIPQHTKVHSFAVCGTNIFAGTNDGVFVSTDSGMVWTATNLVNDITILVASGTNIIAASSLQDAFLSTNNGSTWNDILDSINIGGHGYGVFSLVASDDNVLAGGSDCIFISTNYGINWTNTVGIPCPPGSSPNRIIIRCLAIDGINIYAATQGDIFRSNDNGVSWIALNTPFGIPNNMISVKSNLFAATDYGIWFSTDNGAGWIDAGLENYSINGLIIFGTNLFAGGTNMLTIWRRPLSDMITSVVQQTMTEHSFKLSQNYPNPFNPSTTIRYALPTRTRVTLTVYNTFGQQVAQLMNEVKEPGTYTVKFDGSNLASGVYFYRLRAGDYVFTKKLLLMK